jgi:hypothetical protein
MEILMRIFGYLPIFASVALAAAAQAATSPQVGTAAVTKNSVTGLVGKDQRTLKRGDRVPSGREYCDGAGCRRSNPVSGRGGADHGAGLARDAHKLIFDRAN